MQNEIKGRHGSQLAPESGRSMNKYHLKYHFHSHTYHIHIGYFFGQKHIFLAHFISFLSFVIIFLSFVSCCFFINDSTILLKFFLLLISSIRSMDLLHLFYNYFLMLTLKFLRICSSSLLLNVGKNSNLLTSFFFKCFRVNASVLARIVCVWTLCGCLSEAIKVRPLFSSFFSSPYKLPLFKSCITVISEWWHSERKKCYSVKLYSLDFVCLFVWWFFRLLTAASCRPLRIVSVKVLHCWRRRHEGRTNVENARAIAERVGVGTVGLAGMWTFLLLSTIAEPNAHHFLFDAEVFS